MNEAYIALNIWKFQRKENHGTSTAVEPGRTAARKRIVLIPSSESFESELNKGWLKQVSEKIAWTELSWFRASYCSGYLRG